MIAIALAAALAAAAPSADTVRPSFSMGAIADCQYADAADAPPRLYRTCPDKLEAAVTTMNGWPIEQVFYLGDFIDHDWVSYDRLLPIVARSRHPWRFVLGNHDFSVDDVHKRAVPARLGLRHRYYCFAHGDWLFVVTDGNALSTYAWPAGSREDTAGRAAHAALYADKPEWDGGIDAVQLRWLNRTLARADAKRQKVMILDHFPILPAGRFTLWNAPEVLAIIDRHPSVKVWLNGHDHRGGYAVRTGVHYVTMSAMLDDGLNAFTRLDFYADRIEVIGFGKQQSLSLSLR